MHPDAELCPSAEDVTAPEAKGVSRIFEKLAKVYLPKFMVSPLWPALLEFSRIKSSAIRRHNVSNLLVFVILFLVPPILICQKTLSGFNDSVKMDMLERSSYRWLLLLDLQYQYDLISFRFSTYK